MIRETVFIAVEDDGEEARILESAFRAERSWRLVCLENGPLAMRYMKGEDPYRDRCANPAPDVILLDLKKPQESGTDLLR